MTQRQNAGRFAPLPEGFEYTSDGRVVAAYAQTGPDRGPVEQLIVSRPRSKDVPELQQALDDLATAGFLAEEARYLLDRYARKARSLGATWTQIAQQVGTTPQSAQQRWSDRGNARHNETRRRRTADQNTKKRASNG